MATHAVADTINARIAAAIQRVLPYIAKVVKEAIGAERRPHPMGGRLRARKEFSPRLGLHVAAATWGTSRQHRPRPTSRRLPSWRGRSQS